MLTLHPHQERAVTAGLAAQGRHIFGDEMRLGKTAECITVLKRLDCQRVLIVCPAIARKVWLDSLTTWWPERLSVGILDAGLEGKSLSKKHLLRLLQAATSQVCITSYGLADKLLGPQEDKDGRPCPPLFNHIDTLVLDEIHWLAHFTAKRTQIIRDFVQQRPDLRVYGLTGTPMPNQPLDALAVYEVVWPGRFGGVWKKDVTWKAKMRYSNGAHNGYGWTFAGSNPLYSDELKERLVYGITRTLASEVPELFAAPQVEYITVPGTLTPCENMDALMAASYELKEKYVLEFVDNAMRQSNHVAVLTYRRATATKLADLLARHGYNVTHISGANQPHERNAALELAKTLDNNVLVMTMHSVGIAVDISFAQHILFCELYPKPDTMAQALKRFSHPGKVGGTFITLMAIENSVDEEIASMLVSKLRSIETTSPLGESETLLAKQLGADKNFAEKVALALATYVEDPYDIELSDWEE